MEHSLKEKKVRKRNESYGRSFKGRKGMGEMMSVYDNLKKYKTRKKTFWIYQLFTATTENGPTTM